MLIAIWDFFFTRRVWNTVEEFEIIGSQSLRLKGKGFILKDQFGNIKKSVVNFEGPYEV